MAARKPEEWPSVFDQKLNAGDLEGMIALYEPGAAFVRDSSELIVGRDNIRNVLADLVSRRPNLKARLREV